MNNKTITTITLTQTPLKQRKKNIRNAHTTEPLAICNIIEKIVLMPFSDFMFCHPEEYVSVMEEFTNHKQKWNFPEISTGMAFQFVAEQTGMSPSARITTGDEAIIRKQLLNAVYQPFLDIFDMAVYDPGDPFHGSIHTPEDLLQKSAWRYVNHCRSTHIVYGNKEGIPLHERIQRIENSKEYKAKFYCYNMANTPPAMIPSELGYSFCLFLNNTTFCDYFECLKSMSLTKITPTRNLYNRLEQSHSGYGQDAAILEYYACGDFDRAYFEQGLYALFIYPMAQVYAALIKKDFNKIK